MRRFLCVVLALMITVGCLPCRAVERDEPAQIVLTTQDGTRIEGTADTAVTIRYGEYSMDTSLFSWGAYRHDDFGHLKVNLSDDQVDWAKRQEGPATLEVDGQVFSGTVTCWVPTHWVLSFHPDGGDDSPAGQAIWSAFYGLSSPTAGFADVDPDAWYAPYVDVCVEEGLMKGVGAGLFAPEAYLTAEEALVLLMRFYDLRQGGDGAFGTPPPESWGTAQLTYEDGTALFLNAGQMGGVGTHSGSWYTARLSPEDRAVAESHLEQPATFTNLATGASFSAHTFFQPEQADDPALHISGGHFSGFFESLHKAKWYGNVLWYTLEKGFYDSSDHEGVVSLAVSTGSRQRVQRNELATALAEVAGELEQVNPTPSSYLSREYHEGIYSLYEAGVMTLNSSGDIDSRRLYSPITRAEAATMLARVLRPELRCAVPSPEVEKG